MLPHPTINRRFASAHTNQHPAKRYQQPQCWDLAHFSAGGNQAPPALRDNQSSKLRAGLHIRCMALSCLWLRIQQNCVSSYCTLYGIANEASRSPTEKGRKMPGFYCKSPFLGLLLYFSFFSGLIAPSSGTLSLNWDAKECL